MKKWVVQNKILNIKNKKVDADEIIKILLANRNLKTKKEIEDYLNPKLSDLKIKNVGIDQKELDRSVVRIKEAIKNKEKIIVFGDYDVDGICGSAILWETLNDAGADALPYIPHRIDEGYGISKIGITNIITKHKDTKLIITVDNGIVANEAIEFAKEKGIDVIITDHHVLPSKKPNAYSIVHTTKLCGAGVAYMLAQEFRTKNKFDHLSLAAIATIADLVSLTGANRIVVKFGLEELRKTRRPGIVALAKEAGIDQSKINVYEIGHVFGPRINAMGRLEYAMESLRLLCTKDEKSCEALARKMGITNKRRQEITIESVLHAKEKVKIQNSQGLIIIGHESYQPGVIGLIAGRLVEEFYRPAIVLSIGEKFSKASARSVAGFNIIEFIRMASELLVDAGGHPMAAGFTVETKRIKELTSKLEKLSKKLLTAELLQRILKIDTEIYFDDIALHFYDELLKLSPFGIGNPQPVFLSRNILISDMRMVGIDNRHMSLRLVSSENKLFEAIAFNFSDRSTGIRIGDRIDVAYAIDREVWKGNIKLKLKIKDLKLIGN